MNEKKHVFYFDYLRILAAISVVYMHVAADPLRLPIGKNWHVMNVFTCAAFVAVPLFFMMSGYLLLSGSRTLDITLLFKKRLVRLAVPLAAWTVVALLWKLWLSRDVGAFFDGAICALKSPAWVHFWYMYTLIALYVLSPILCAALRGLDRKGHILLFSLCVSVSVLYMLKALLPPEIVRFFDLDIISKVTVYGGHLSTFILGYYLGKSEVRVKNSVLISLALAVFAVIVYGTWRLTAESGTFDQTFQGQAAGFEVLLAALLFLFFKQNFNRPAKHFDVRPIVALSLSVYLMHNLLLSVLVHEFLSGITTFLDTVKITVLVFAISFFTMKTVATIKPLCFLFTGQSFSDACQTCNWIYTREKLRSSVFKRRKK